MDIVPAPPPALPRLPAPPPVRLFSINQIGTAALLGSPLAGVILLAVNYLRLGRVRDAVHSLLSGVGALAMVMALFGVLPELPPFAGLGVAFALAAATRQVAQRLQARDVDAHRLAGGARGSRWGVAGAVLLGGALVLGIATLVLFLAGELFYPRVDFPPNDEVYYSAGATQEEARRLGRFLQQWGWFGQPAGASVGLLRRAQTTVVRLIMQKHAAQDAEIIEVLRELRSRLADEVFQGGPVEIEICDADFQAERVLK